MTMISEMLLKGEASAGSTISIDAMDDKKCLKYEVVKDVAASESCDGSGDLVMATPIKNPENVRPPKTSPPCVSLRGLKTSIS
jgi:hypothetical protein